MTANDGFTDSERAAIRARAQELRSRTDGSDGEGQVLAAIDKMVAEEQEIALAFHALVRENAPDLVPRTWYGMPAYATPGKKGKVVCFFKHASKFGARYNEIGFSDSAALDDGSMWPISFAVTQWTSDDEARLRTLVQQAAR